VAHRARQLHRELPKLLIRDHVCSAHSNHFAFGQILAGEHDVISKLYSAAGPMKPGGNCAPEKPEFATKWACSDARHCIRRSGRQPSVGGMALDIIKRLVRRLAWRRRRRQQQRRLAGLEVTDDEALRVICCRHDPVVRARRGGSGFFSFCQILADEHDAISKLYSAAGTMKVGTNFLRLIHCWLAMVRNNLVISKSAPRAACASLAREVLDYAVSRYERQSKRTSDQKRSNRRTNRHDGDDGGMHSEDEAIAMKNFAVACEDLFDVLNDSLSSPTFLHPCTSPGCCANLNFSVSMLKVVSAIIKFIMASAIGMPGVGKWTKVGPCLDKFVMAQSVNIFVGSDDGRAAVDAVIRCWE